MNQPDLGVGGPCSRDLKVAVTLVLLLALAAPSAASATVSLAAWTQHSPDDISGFLTLTGNDAIVTPSLGFTVTIEGVNYTTVAISTNGWLEFGGNTQGTSHPANVCLPTATHTNPFIAAYWDDLNPFGTIIRYGMVGASPNRTFIADFEVDLVSGTEGQDDLRFQVQVHEGSNLINVRYRNMQNGANGQAATIGFQGAGGAGGNAQPIACNTKVLDDNSPNEGWSVDAGRAGLVTLYALMAHSPDDIVGFTPLSGDDNIAGVALPFTVTIEGTNYSNLTIGTNGTIQFGTTSGANPSANTALPSASFPNPTIFYFWDNLQTEGGNVRYGSVGTSPNRVFIVDFQENLVAASGDKVNGQVQIHERSNLINVKYRNTLSGGANGQTATIGFQGAGGASAAAYPLTFNGKILDDNRPDEGWSVHPKSLGAMSLHATIAHSPDDIGGFLTVSGDESAAGVTLPFSVTIDGVSYSTLTIGSNGIIQFGTLAGANPAANAALPSGSFPNPTIFYYWDNLQTEGGHVRYGTVGSSPHRTFIVDFQENLVASSGDKVNGQVQIHEGSNVVSVKYRSTLSANANGQSATIGFQGAGGAAAAAYPLTFNGKILDDNLPDAGWSVAPLPICGNSITETREQCDSGAANGTLPSCCTATCGFKTNGTACTDDGNLCTNDQCNGASAICQHPNNSAPCSDALFCNGTDTCGGGSCSVHSGDPCQGADGDADCSETCNEAADNCDGNDPNGAACAGNGAGECTNADTCLTGACQNNDLMAGLACTDVAPPSTGNCLDAQCNGGGACDQNFANEANGTGCNDGLFCNGGDTCSSGACSTHTGDPCVGPDGDLNCSESCNEAGDNCSAADPDGTLCRPDAGECDVQETCSGGSCPADDFETSGTACGSSGDSDCDNPDTCDGAGACAINNEPVTTECRADAGDCDVADNCDGAGNCPADAFEPSGTTCGDPSDTDCSNPDTCDGAGICTVNHEPNTVLCRPAAMGQDCDVAEQCDGAGTCPADGVLPTGTTCRPDAGECDVAETCDGISSACPADGFEPPVTACGDPTDTDCTNADTCDGSGTCLSNHEAFGFGCGDISDTDCSDPDACDGAGTCETNHEPSGTTCTDDGETCSDDECDGSGACAHSASNAGVECRAASPGQLCDEAEQCDGSTPSCPADGVKPAGAVCRLDAGDCDLEEQCDGIASVCPADAFEPASTPCGDASDTDCTNPDSCDGGGICASNHEPSSLVCRAASAGLACDATELCDGAGNCPADGVLPSGTTCRAAADACDVAEACDGMGSTCPADALAMAGAPCASDSNPCTLDQCDGAGICAHPAGNAGTTCRPNGGACDVAETCTGLSTTCPPDASEPDGTSCSDAQFCNGVDACTAGVCVSPGSPCGMGETCNEATDGCFIGGCPTTPATCLTSAKSLLLIKNDATDKKDKLIWKWIRGAPTIQADYADPRGSAEYAFCLYAGGSLLTYAVVPPGTLWNQLGDKGYIYRDPTNSVDGINKLFFKGTGAPGRSKALLKGRGVNLRFEPLPLPIAATPVVAQLRNNDTGFCMQGSYASPLLNTTNKYKAKQ